MTRTYTLKKRAERQDETRRRIIEAAIDLHGTIGPAKTTFSMVAARAGVQRHTLYAHFPDERSLGLACSGLHMEREPPPDAAAWRAIESRPERLNAGLRAIYDWYGRNEAMAAHVLRDAETHALTRELAELTWAPFVHAWEDVLGGKLNAQQRAMLRLALSFYTWRTLTRDGGLQQAAAVAEMVQAIEGAV